MLRSVDQRAYDIVAVSFKTLRFPAEWPYYRRSRSRSTRSYINTAPSTQACQTSTAVLARRGCSDPSVGKSNHDRSPHLPLNILGCGFVYLTHHVGASYTGCQPLRWSRRRNKPCAPHTYHPSLTQVPTAPYIRPCLRRGIRYSDWLGCSRSP